MAVHLGPFMITGQLMTGVPFGAFVHDDAKPVGPLGVKSPAS